MWKATSLILLLLLASVFSQQQRRPGRTLSAQHTEPVVTQPPQGAPSTEPVKADGAPIPSTPVQVPIEGPAINPFGPSFIPAQGTQQTAFSFFPTQMVQPLFNDQQESQLPFILLPLNIPRIPLTQEKIPQGTPRSKDSTVIPKNLQSPCYSSVDCQQERVLMPNSDPFTCIMHNGGSWKVLDFLCFNLKPRNVNTQGIPPIPFVLNLPVPTVNPLPQWAALNPLDQIMTQILTPKMKPKQVKRTLNRTEQDMENSCFSELDCTGEIIKNNVKPRSCMKKGGLSWKMSNVGTCINMKNKLKDHRPIIVVARADAKDLDGDDGDNWNIFDDEDLQDDEW